MGCRAIGRSSDLASGTNGIVGSVGLDVMSDAADDGR